MASNSSSGNFDTQEHERYQQYASALFSELQNLREVFRRLSCPFPGRVDKTRTPSDETPLEAVLLYSHSHTIAKLETGGEDGSRRPAHMQVGQ